MRPYGLRLLTTTLWFIDQNPALPPCSRPLWGRFRRALNSRFKLLNSMIGIWLAKTNPPCAQPKLSGPNSVPKLALIHFILPAKVGNWVDSKPEGAAERTVCETLRSWHRWELNRREASCPWHFQDDSWFWYFPQQRSKDADRKKSIWQHWANLERWNVSEHGSQNGASKRSAD